MPIGIVRSTTDPGDRTVALTFDDGPDPRWTPQVLALLDEYDVKATFCMVGPNAARHPDLVRRVADAGHRLCDHSVTHDEEIDKRSAPRVRYEIVSARDEIARAAPGHDVDWFRAPGGAWSPTVRQMSAAYGMKPLGWSVDTRDWEKPGVDTILDNVRRELRPGGVVLMHDAGGDRTQSIDALARLLPWLKDHGYRFAFPG
ncbi:MULTISPECIES: polysaccharide deacetylase family protein [unclassified Embleya]|uniref:polysaccharide deacetylase family protein n=1 Tax=unclassified Embleya TaxID=2699296 RepID=UPI003405F1DF